MKFKFDRTKVFWDDYCRFHTNLEYANGFIVFETGEAICTRCFDNDPDRRTLYNKWHVQIVGTNDTNCPKFTDLDGKPIAKTWLDNNGQQILLIDHDHGIAVALGQRGGLDPRFVQPWQANVPESLRGRAYAYWPGPNSPPLGGRIVVNQSRRLTPEQRAHCEGLLAECKAWDVMSEQPLRVGHHNKGMYAWVPGEETRKPLSFDRMMAVENYLVLSIDERLDLSRHGYKTGLDPRKVPYLKLVTNVTFEGEDDEDTDVDTA